MALTRPTLQQITDRVAADIVSKISGATTLAMRSFLRILGAAFAAAAHLIYGYLDNQAKELFATTATADADGGRLDTIGNELGIPRNAAAKAVGSATFTGTAASVIPAGSALNSEAGNRYVTDAELTVGGGGSVVGTVTCDTAGAAGNDSPGVILSFESPVAGVDSDATVDADGLYGGIDVETDAAYRARILARKRLAPHGGANHDLVAWMLEVDGVTRAWVHEQYQGAGTFLCLFVFDDQTPITPTGGQITAMTAYLTEHTGADGQIYGIPVTALPGMFVQAPVLRTVDFTIKITPNNSTVQAAITAALTDYLYESGTPGATLYMSKIDAAISASSNLTAHRVVVPAADVVLAYNEVAKLGTITWQDY